MKKILLLACLMISIIYTTGQQSLNKKDLEELKERMIGSFSSEQQAKSDSDYYDIRLHMAQIWNKQKNGYWLYVEQAAASTLSKPYRQRIYHLYQPDDSTFVSKVYELKTPLRFAGAWSDISAFNNLNPDSLVDRQGCSIFLRKNSSGDYYGSTSAKECLSTLRGAAYATSEVIIEKDKLLSWDRGWSKDGKQVWGAEKGGYNFIKLKE